MANSPPTRAGIDDLIPQALVSRVRFEKHVIALRERTTFVLLVLFALAVLSTYTLIFLWGFHRIELPPPFVHWLGAATVGQIASLLAVIVRSLFPSQQTE